MEGDLDDLVLNTIIVDVLYNPTINPANQNAQNDPQASDSTNQEAQGSRDLETPNSRSNGEHIQLITLDLTTLSTNSAIEEETHSIEGETHPPRQRNNEISSFLDKSNILLRFRRNAHAVVVQGVY